MLKYRKPSFCFIAISVFFLIQARAAFENTVYISPALVRGNFFESWVDAESRGGVRVDCRYERTLDGKTFGNFFGPSGSADFVIGPRYLADVHSGLLIHGDAQQEQQAVRLRPASFLHKAGFELWGNITPDRWENDKKLLLFAGLDVVQVENSLNPQWGFLENRRRNLEHDYQDFFEGRYNSSVGAILQDRLLAQKFNKAPMKNGGLSSFSLGVLFQHELEDEWYWRAQGLVSIPCSQSSGVEYLFLPRRGMERHWGLGLAVDFKIPLSRGYELLMGLQDMFWLSAKHVRTARIATRPYGHYVALSENNQDHKPVIPAANLLSMENMVSPGHATTARLGIHKQFEQGHVVSIVWQGTYKQQERLSLLEQWMSSRYAVPHPTFDTATQFGAAPNYTDFDVIDPIVDIGDAAFLRKKDLDFSVGAAPAFFEHHFKCNWEGALPLKNKEGVKMGPKIALGYRLMQGASGNILPDAFTCEIGFYGVF